MKPNKINFGVLIILVIGFLIFPKITHSATISWHEENGYSVMNLQNEQENPACSKFNAEILVGTKKVIEMGTDINNPLSGQSAGQAVFTCLNCGPGATLSNDEDKPGISYGLLKWDTTNVDLSKFTLGAAVFKISAKVGAEIIYGAVCVKINNVGNINSVGNISSQGSQLSWTDKVINLANNSSPLICQDDKLIGEVRVGEKKKITYETKINNTNNLDLTFSCLNCGAGVSFVKKSNTAATLEWDTTNVDLTQFSKGRAVFQVLATAGSNNSVVGSVCAKVLGLCEKTDGNSCKNTSGCVWLPAGKCVSSGDTTVNCVEIAPQDVCISMLHCKFEDNKCVFKNKIDQSKAIDKFIASTHGKPDGYTGPLPDCAFTGSCRSIEDLIGLGVKVADWLFGIIAGLGFAFFVYGGVTMIFSFGNAEKVGQGKQILVAAVIGIVIAFSAYVLVGFIVKAIGINSDLLPF